MLSPLVELAAVIAELPASVTPTATMGVTTDGLGWWRSGPTEPVVEGP